MKNNKTISKWFSMLLLMLVDGIMGATAQSLSIADFSIKAGETQEVAIILTADNDIYGVQTDMELSEGLTLESAAAVQEGMTFNKNTLNSGKIRMSLLSFEGATVSTGDIIILSLKAADNFAGGTIKLSNSRLTTSTAGAEDKISDDEATVTLESEPGIDPNELIVNGDFEGTYSNKIQNSSGNNLRYVREPEGWVLEYSDGCQWDASILSKDDELYNTIGSKITIPGDGRGNQTYAVRLHGNAQNSRITLTQGTHIFPKGKYTLTGSFFTENQNELEVGFFLGSYSNETRIKYTGGNGNWRTLTTEFESDGTLETAIGVFFKHNSGNAMIAGVDNITITFTPFVYPTALTLNESSLNLTIGETATLAPTLTPADANKDFEITWESSDPKVATVVDGVVTAVGPGSATITATTGNNIASSCEVTVADVEAVAAPSFYSELTDGDFFVVNAATGQFLGVLKEGWGTQAALADHGIPFTAKAGEGVYTLNSHTYNSKDEHFFNGTYVDGGSTSLFITALGGGKYSISTEEGSAFVTANTANAIVANNASSANSVLAQWYFVSKADLENALANAKNSSPVDATFYIGDPDFSRNHIFKALQHNKTDNPGGETYPWSYTVTNYTFKGGDNGNMCAESYHSAGTVSQTLTVPNGKYVVKCQGFRRQDDNSTDESYLFANGEKIALKVFNGNSEGTNASMGGASASFSAGLYQNELTVYVTDGSLEIGIQGTAHNWTIWDNFELYYYGPTIAGEAQELPEGDVTAESWYYFDVDIDGQYNITATTLSDIVYTTDGTILIENQASVTDQFAGTEAIDLTAGRYYIKSASAQPIAVAANSYSYSLGEAELSVGNNGYTQSSVFTVLFPSATSNDPAAATELVESSTATVNGENVALTAVEGGFKIDFGSVTAGTDYAIEIPEGVYGYADQSMNEAISLTIHTPAVLDGEYCLFDAADELFLGRGGSWGTEAVADKYGIPFNLVTNAEGVSSIEFVDWSGVYLYKTNEGGIYTDNASTGWIVVPAGDGYILKDANSDSYAKAEKGSLGNYLHIVEGENDATIWMLMRKADRDAIVDAYPVNNVSNVITAAGLTLTAEDFDAYLSDNCQAVDMTSNIGTATFNGSAGDWTWSQVRGQENQPAYGNGFAEIWCATGAYSQTIAAANLPAGVYKVTVQGYERRKDNNASSALYANGYNLVSTYLSANGEQVRFTDWNEVDGKPTNTGSAVSAFGNGQAVNEVYVYLDGATDLTITVRKPNYIWDCWTIFNNFTLTRYAELSSVQMVVTAAAQYGTFVAPFDVEIPEEVTAYIVEGANENKELQMTEVADIIPANTPVVLFSETEVDIEVKGVADAVETPTKNWLVGTYKEIPAQDGWYILQKHGDAVAFYRVDTEKAQPKVPANRAYLSVPSSEARVFHLNGEATAIKAIEALTVGEAEIYDVNGRRQVKLQKGVNIIRTKDGRTNKVMVK